MITINKQVVKIEYEDSEVFFFDHSFKSGYEHSEEFIERNRGKFNMEVYHVNRNPFGERWTHVKSVMV